MLNNVILVGRLTAHPETRHFESGKICATFNLALNRPSKDKDVTDFFQCKAWGKSAEIVAEYARKGHRLGVIGTLEQERWQDDNGNTRSKVIVNAQNVRLIETKKESEGGSNNAGDESDDIFGGED